MAILAEGVPAPEFLEASDGMLQLFGEDAVECATAELTEGELLSGLLGHGVFSFIQADIRSNIAVSSILLSLILASH